jgi:hypothetical protein
MCGIGIGGSAATENPKTGTFVGDVPIGKTVMFQWVGPWTTLDECTKCGFVDEDRQHISGSCPKCGNGHQPALLAQSLGEKFKEGMVYAACGLIFFGGMSIIWGGIYWFAQHNS